MNGILAVVGLSGTGKSTVVQLLQNATGVPVVYFGGVIVNEVRRRGLDVTEANERSVREELRATHGMAVVAQLAAKEVDAALETSTGVIIDGLYSQAEYDTLVARYPRLLRTLAVHAPRRLREDRLSARPDRPLTPDEVHSRDLREIATLDKATPIALADWHLINDSSMEALTHQLKQMDYLLDGLSL